jgi:twitching motility protein PilT
MTDVPNVDTPVYPARDDRLLSLRELLAYIGKVGPMRSSDLHLKVGCPPTYRIDGELQPMHGPPLDAAMLETLARAMLSDQKWAALQADRSVDGSLTAEGLQFRVNCFHDRDGLVAAVRALDMAPLPVERIGFPNGVWQDILNLRRGLVLFTGVTGAGKSTTIASLLHRITQTRACRIITLEDPIEYILPSGRAIISQREVGTDVPSFGRGLRDCLREDPDVIFVGEMRDRESTVWALTAAETGHVVFSTLHTRDARGTITRIIDMYPAERQDEIASQLSLGLAYVVCQKLIPRADGLGRVVAMEVLNNTYALANLIRLRKVEQIYSQLQLKTRDVPGERMMTLEHCLVGLVRAGVVSPLEAERWANDRVAFLGELKGRADVGA